MAEDTDSNEVSSEADLLANQIQDLLSSEDVSQDDPKTQIQALELLFGIIVERENEILESNGSNELFYSIMLAVAAHRIGTWIESCKEFADSTLKTADIILGYCLSQIHSTKSHAFFSKSKLVKIVEGLCLGKGCFDKDDLTKISDAFGGLKSPESLRSTSSERKPVSLSLEMISSPSKLPFQILHQSQFALRQGTDWIEAYKVHCQQTMRSLDGGSTLLEYALCLPALTLFHCYFDELGSDQAACVNRVSILRIENLSEELLLANNIVTFPSVIVAKAEQMQRLGSLVCKCLKAALFLAVGRYEVITDDDGQVSCKAESTMEDSCRKLAWRATEASLAVFKSVVTAISGSTRFGGGICENVQAIATEAILNGFSHVLNDKNLGKLNVDSEVISSKWRWFSGFNIMLVTMASRVVTLMLSLLDDLELECIPSSSSGEKCRTVNYLVISTQCTAWQRMQWLLARNDVPKQLWKLFCASYKMANSIKNMKTFQTEENEEEAVSEAAETAKTSAEEESGEEEGSVLGQWLNNILLQSTTSKCEAKKEKPDDVVSDDAYTQSLDIFVLLGNNLLDLCTKLFPMCMQYNFEDIVKHNFDEEGIKSLAHMVNQIDSNGDELSVKEDLCYYFKSYLIMLYSSKVMDQDKLELLLAELGLGLESKQHAWPLYVSPISLSLYGRLALAEQEISLREGSGSADTPRAMSAWERFLERLERPCIDGRMDTERDVNVEHMQLLASLFVNFSTDCKQKLVKQCFDSVKKMSVDISDDLPLRAYRLIVILDFMFRAFSVVPHKLFQQLSHNVLSVSPKIADSRQIDFVGSSFKEEESYLSLVKKVKSSTLQNALLQQQPRFYELLPDDFNKAPSDLKVFRSIGNFDVASAEYSSLYTSFLTLCSSLLNYIDKHHAQEERILQVVASRSCFQHIWRLLLYLPPPLLLLKELTAPDKIWDSNEQTLFFLRVMPVVFLNLKADKKALTKKLFIFDDVITDDVIKVVEEIVTECGKTQYIADLTTNMTIEEADIGSSEKIDWTKLMLIDAVSCLLHVLLENVIILNPRNEEEKERLAKLCWLTLNNVVSCYNQIKQSVITHNGERPSKDVIEIYSKLIGATTSHHLKDAVEINFSSGLPEEMKKAAGKWKDVLLTQFPSSKHFMDESNASEVTDMTSYVDGLLSAHVTVFVTGISFREPAFTLKHLLKSCVELMHSVLKWLKNNADDHFQLIQINAITVFVNLVTDSIADHLLDTANEILKMTVGTSDSEKLQEILHSHVLSLCFFIVDEEVNRADKFLTSEQTVIQCLGFIERSLQRFDTPCSAADYFSTGYSTKLASILLSIKLSKFSKLYAGRVLKMFTNLLTSPESIQQRSIHKAIVEIFNIDSAELQEWLHCEVMSDSSANEDPGTSHQAIVALQKFVNSASKEPDVDMKYMLETALTVFENLLKMCIKDPAEAKNIPFADFLDALISISSAAGATGHIMLIRSVQGWINVGREAVSENFKQIKENSAPADEDLMKCISVLLRYLNQVLTGMRKCCSKESSHLTLHLSYSENDYSSRDRSETELDDDMNSDDEDSGGEESEEDSICNKLCTFTTSQRDFMNQHWYHCHTCKMNDGVGCCTICAKVCHKDHDVSYAKYGSFFCDCGAKEDGSCRSMTKRSPTTGYVASRHAAPSPFAAWTSDTELSESRQRNAASSSEVKPVLKRGKSLEKSQSSDARHQDSSTIHLFGNLLKESKDEIFEILKDKNCIGNYMELFQEVLEYKEFVSKTRKENSQAVQTMHEALESLYCHEKDVQASDQLMIPILGSQEGAFESVRLNFNGEQGQTLRQLINAHVLRHSAMCLMASTNGKRQHLAITHEKGKITILQLSGLLKQPDTSSRKLTLNRLSSTALPFTIVSIQSNVENEDALAVCGLKDCHVITYGHGGSVASHIALPLQLETGNFVIKAVWVPGEQTKIALLTADFVKVYDLSASVSTPDYHYVLPGGKVRDATFINDGTSVRIAVMSSHGHVYTESMNESTGADGGAFFLTNAITVSHPTLKDGNGQVAGGGVSLYYSHVLKLMFFSYSQGKSFVGVLNKTYTEMDKVFNLSSGITSHAPLCHWHEILGQPGLLHCVSQSSGNPVLVMVTPEKILIQELKGTPLKSKIQDAVCYYHTFPVTRNTDTTIQQKTTMIVLLEDGSLRIYNAHKDYVNYWSQSKFKPRAFPQLHPSPKKTKASKSVASSMPINAASFPIDFFEHCQPTNEVEFGGSDILHVYNAQQVKHRLNTAGMYIASTKASGFKVEVTNTNASHVMVGLRVHLGMRCLEKTPTYIEVFGRVVPLRMSRNRWFDIPFTKAESLTADKKVTITFGPSSDSSGVNMIDSIKVYYKTKENFGWPEDASESTGQHADLQHHSASVVTATEAPNSCETSKSEPLLIKLLETLNEHVLCFPIEEESSIHQALLDLTTKLMVGTGSQKLQCQAKTLMASLFSSKNDFFDWKDEAQIGNALTRFKAATAPGQHVSGAPYIESVQELLSVARTVGNARPKNLIKALKDFDKEEDVLDNLMSSFWKLYAMRPVNYILAPIEARAIGSLDGTIEALVEVLFAVLLGDPEKFSKLMDTIVRLLLSKDFKVSFAVKQGLSQAMQIRRKVTVVSEPSPTQSDSPAIEDLNQEHTLMDEGPVAVEQPRPESIVQEIDSFPEGAIEDLEPQQNGLQALLGGDDAVMELALALSLQDQDSENFVDDDDDEDDADDVDLEDDTDGPLPGQRYDSLVQGSQQLIGSAGSGRSNANELMDEGSVLAQSSGRERKLSRDSERSCPTLSKDKKVVEITDVALEASWSKIFNFFIQHLQELKSVNGIQAIPYLQVLLMLCTSLTDSAKDQEDLERVVSACLDVLKLDVKDLDSVAERDAKKEVQLVTIRFFSVLLSQSRTLKDFKSDEEESSSRPKSGRVVAKILSDKGIVKYCLDFLESLLPYWRRTKTSTSTDSSEDDEVLLKPSPTQNPPDMSPFFLKQYVKSHANDLFEAFPQLVTEMVLRLPYQIRKRLDSVDQLQANVFGSQWIYCLCEYMMATETPFIKRHVRKLLLVLCGSKDKYRRVKDLHTLKAHISVIRNILQPGGSLSDAQTNFSYEETVKLADDCKACADIAMARIENWQIFCKQEKGVLPFLVQSSYRLSSEHVSGIFLQLIGLALGNSSSKSSSSGKGDEKGEKATNKDTVKELVGILFGKCYSTLLFTFIKSFLLESNSTSMRWKAHELLYTVFKNISSEQRIKLVELMWQLWSYVPFAGHKAAQFVDLLGYFTVKSPDIMNKMECFIRTVFSLLSFSNNLLQNHPNASIYRRLQSLVEVSGFYLENDPCIVCNNPEIPFTHAKLTSIKADIRYTTTAQLVKLSVNYTISRLLLRISDIKRAKMVKTINIYYSNKPVPSVVELKNKRNIWQKAKRITLTADQTDVKVDFTLPIVAYNLMIEYADFYDNIQLSAESLQCPRCSASVPANPGVCANCGENVYQCHKCRAINYDERDPFLCTSCGFCKYAKFEYTLVTRPCCAVEPVNDETERQTALNSVNNLLESADKIYQQLSNHKQSLESSLRGISEESGSSSKTSGTSSSAASGASASNAVQVNKNIQNIAQQYCVDCKTSFEELSKIIQKVTATRKELSSYDQRQQEVLSTIVATSPAASPISREDGTFSESSSGSNQATGKGDLEADAMGKCYGCGLFTVEHCLTILRAFATIKESHKWMLSQGLLHELLEHSLQHRKTQVTVLARKLIILITTGNIEATNELNQMIKRQVELSLESKAANVTLDLSLQSQMSVLGLSLNTLDDCWHDRLRCVFSLFLDSMKTVSTDVLENVTLPCLKVLANTIQKASTALDEKGKKDNLLFGGINAVKWLNGSSKYTLKYWRAKNQVPTREEFLAEKFASIWLRKIEASKKRSKVQEMTGESWLRLLLFAPSSRAVRETVCGILESLCKMESKKKKMLLIFTSYLDDLHKAGENASDFFNLYKLMIKSPEWKRHLVSCGILEKVTSLIVKEVEYLNSLENRTVGFDLSQGFALHALADILKMLFEDEVVKAENKSTFVGYVLQCYLSLRRLVVQRTKLIDAAQDILLSLLEELTTGTEAEERAFMVVCISALKEYPISDIRTPVFIYERLCNIIHKEEKEVNEFFVIIEKDPQQEDFLQGRMPGNPYSSKETGLGPLMRDIKNKICTECELVALLEDDTGMELLVNNKIISLDLPVADVYKKIWCAKGERPEAMKIVYRMRGLLGDATEDMVDNLDNDKDKDIDEEYEYRQAGVISEVGGLDIILRRLSYIRDLSRAQELISVMLKLLEYCVKVKVNRQYLGKNSVNSLKIMLGTLNLALRLEKEKGSGSGGAMIAERLLNIMGIVLHEASEQADQCQLSSLPGEGSQLELLLGHITSPYVRGNPNVLEAMMRLIPSLSFGSEQSMLTLINHFIPYLKFNSFDEGRSADENLYLECFCVITNGISNTTSGSRLKDLILEHGIPQRALGYLNEHTPPKSFSASGILDANRWKEFLVRPALPYVLRILTGLVGGHEATQSLVGTEENIALHHRLEQVSSEESVGSLAENLIEALRENPVVAKKVQSVRCQTREDKKKMALAMRQKQLEALGMVVTEGGQIKSKPSSVIREMEELLEEKGLICCICREGYKFHPKKVLAVYTYTTRCVLEEFESKPRKSQGYSTVSHFNVIHVDCHNEAIRHARSRDEWESAALQNANTKCNGLMPIWGPKVSESAFATCLARHNNYLQECTGFHEPTFHSTVHDLKLLLLRFALEKSFSDEAGGGGRISNIYLFPYTAHVAVYVLNTARLHLTEENIISTFLDAAPEKWIDSAYEVEGPLFVTILSLFTMPLDKWKEKRLLFLQRLLVIAHARSLSVTNLKKWPEDTTPKEFSVYKPMLVFYELTNQFHLMFKAKIASSGMDWSSEMSTFIRNNDEAILKSADKLLSFYENDLLPCESFEEFFDVAGLLTELQDPSNFLAETLAMVR